MHLQTSNADKETRSAKLILFVVVTKDMANVLTKKTFNALAKLLHAIDIALVHFPVCISARCERWNLCINPVIPADVRYQVFDHRESMHGLYADWIVERQCI